MNAIIDMTPLKLSAAKPRTRNLEAAAVLGVACTAATALGFPYQNAVMPVQGVSGALLVIVVLVSAGVQGGLSFLLAWGGLALGRPLGLDSPFARGVRPDGRTMRTLAAAALIGLALGAATITALYLFPMAAPPNVPRAARWQGALASVSAGVLEEVMTRLFLMTLVAWVLTKVTKSRGNAVFVTASLVAALAFAAMHLPQASMLFGGLSARLVVTTVVCNGALGFAFGMIYRRWGLEHAMLAHCAADIVLHVLAA